MNVTSHEASVEPVWQPNPSSVADSRITEFTDFVRARTGRDFATYTDLWSWSTDRIDEFWASVWDYFDIGSDYTEVLDDPVVMPGARWFPGTRLNFAEQALRRGGINDTALISISENGAASRIDRQELRRMVGALAHWLRKQGVTVGDRVAGYLPNAAETVIAFLATASIGAVWSQCGQDYGASGAAARLAQLEPVVLFTADGYRWNGHEHDRREEVRELQGKLPTLKRTVIFSNLGLKTDQVNATSWTEATAVNSEIIYEQVDFDAPLWVLFSSGTTGLPKGIVHGHGGVVLDHYRLHGLHHDLREGDRFFWYTTTNWMMWNMVVSALLVGAGIVLYDGSPTVPDPRRLWQIAAEHQVDVLGVSPGYLVACAKAGIEPGRDLDLSNLRILGSTGAPLPMQCYSWVRDHVGKHVQLASVTGGTDVVSGFAGSAPNTAVWPGELSAPLLGVALEAWNDDGQPRIDEVGELVITKPMPSMPLYFWNDPDGQRYHDAYFSSFPGVWRHGDWITITSRGGVIVSGRSDSTLNRQGVRLGSADIYDIVEDLPGVREALVIGAELPGNQYWMPLFLVIEDGFDLDEEMKSSINESIRTQASPRHVPDEIVAVPAIPHTRTGKKLEVPVKRLLQGTSIDKVANLDAVDNPAALEYFTRFARTDRTS